MLGACTSDGKAEEDEALTYPVDGPRRDVNEQPPILLSADVEVSTPSGDPSGAEVTVSYTMTAQLDTMEGAILNLAFAPNSTPTQNPNEPASMLVSASMDTYTGAYSVANGLGTVPAGGESPPEPDGSFMMNQATDHSNSSGIATRPLDSQADTASSKYQLKPIKGIRGEIPEGELQKIRPYLVVHQRAEGLDQRRTISYRYAQRMRRAVLDRDGELDSIYVDAISNLPVREIARQSNGDFVSMKYEYSRQGSSLLVQSMSETEVFTAGANQSIVVRRRMSNVKIH